MKIELNHEGNMVWIAAVAVAVATTGVVIPNETKVKPIQQTPSLVSKGETVTKKKEPDAMAETSSKLKSLKQPPFNTTMMGVVKSAADHYDLKLSDAMLFGLSGHAFIINIHQTLCPSGPYCWKRERIDPLIANLGLKMTNLGFYGTGTDAKTKATIDAALRNVLDKGMPCSLMNMENQLINGYDDTGFFTAQPWKNNFPPKKLSFGSWKEFGKRYHANFYTFEKKKPIDLRAAVLASLDYAVDMHRKPEDHTSKAYGIGPRAYDNWIAAIPKHGKQHGNWWNGAVWAVCRHMAAVYFKEVGTWDTSVAKECEHLTQQYQKISDNLKKVSDRKLAPEKQIARLREAKKIEIAAIEKIAALAEKLRKGNVVNE
jgi:hypothetical protein